MIIQCGRQGYLVKIEESDPIGSYLSDKIQSSDFTECVPTISHDRLIIRPKITGSLDVISGKLTLERTTPLEPGTYYGTNQDGDKGFYHFEEIYVKKVIPEDIPGYLLEKIIFTDGITYHRRADYIVLDLNLTDSLVVNCIDGQRYLMLDGDVESPGPLKIYTVREGVRGWYDLPPYYHASVIRGDQPGPLSNKIYGHNGLFVAEKYGYDEEGELHYILALFLNVGGSLSVSSFGDKHVITLASDSDMVSSWMFYGTDEQGRKKWLSVDELSVTVFDKMAAVDENSQASYLSEIILPDNVTIVTRVIRNENNEQQLEIRSLVDDSKVKTRLEDLVASYLQDRIKFISGLSAEIITAEDNYQSLRVFSTMDTTDELVSIEYHTDPHSGYLIDKLRAGDGIKFQTLDGVENIRMIKDVLVATIKYKRSVTFSEEDNALTLVNDVDNPPPYYYYGIHDEDRGWYRFPEHRIVAVSETDVNPDFLNKKLIFTGGIYSVVNPPYITRCSETGSNVELEANCYGEIVLGVQVSGSLDVYYDENNIPYITLKNDIFDQDLQPNMYYGTAETSELGWYTLPYLYVAKASATSTEARVLRDLLVCTSDILDFEVLTSAGDLVDRQIRVSLKRSAVNRYSITVNEFDSVSLVNDVDTLPPFFVYGVKNNVYRGWYRLDTYVGKVTYYGRPGYLLDLLLEKDVLKFTLTEFDTIEIGVRVGRSIVIDENENIFKLDNDIRVIDDNEWVERNLVSGLIYTANVLGDQVNRQWMNICELIGQYTDEKVATNEVDTSGYLDEKVDAEGLLVKRVYMYTDGSYQISIEPVVIPAHYLKGMNIYHTEYESCYVGSVYGVEAYLYTDKYTNLRTHFSLKTIDKEQYYGRVSLHIDEKSTTYIFSSDVNAEPIRSIYYGSDKIIFGYNVKSDIGYITRVAVLDGEEYFDFAYYQSSFIEWDKDRVGFVEQSRVEIEDATVEISDFTVEDLTDIRRIVIRTITFNDFESTNDVSVNKYDINLPSQDDVYLHFIDVKYNYGFSKVIDLAKSGDSVYLIGNTHLTNDDGTTTTIIWYTSYNLVNDRHETYKVEIPYYAKVTAAYVTSGYVAITYTYEDENDQNKQKSVFLLVNQSDGTIAGALEFVDTYLTNMSELSGCIVFSGRVGDNLADVVVGAYRLSDQRFKYVRYGLLTWVPITDLVFDTDDDNKRIYLSTSIYTTNSDVPQLRPLILELTLDAISDISITLQNSNVVILNIEEEEKFLRVSNIRYQDPDNIYLVGSYYDGYKWQPFGFVFDEEYEVRSPTTVRSEYYNQYIYDVFIDPDTSEYKGFFYFGRPVYQEARPMQNLLKYVSYAFYYYNGKYYMCFVVDPSYTVKVTSSFVEGNFLFISGYSQSHCFVAKIDLDNFTSSWTDSETNITFLLYEVPDINLLYPVTLLNLDATVEDSEAWRDTTSVQIYKRGAGLRVITDESQMEVKVSEGDTQDFTVSTYNNHKVLSTERAPEPDVGFIGITRVGSDYAVFGKSTKAVIAIFDADLNVKKVYYSEEASFFVDAQYEDTNSRLYVLVKRGYNATDFLVLFVFNSNTYDFLQCLHLSDPDPDVEGSRYDAIRMRYNANTNKLFIMATIAQPMILTGPTAPQSMKYTFYLFVIDLSTFSALCYKIPIEGEIYGSCLPYLEGRAIQFVGNHDVVLFGRMIPVPFSSGRFFAGPYGNPTFFFNQFSRSFVLQFNLVQDTFSVLLKDCLFVLKADDGGDRVALPSSCVFGLTSDYYFGHAYGNFTSPYPAYVDISLNESRAIPLPQFADFSDYFPYQYIDYNNQGLCICGTTVYDYYIDFVSRLVAIGGGGSETITDIDIPVVSTAQVQWDDYSSDALVVAPYSYSNLIVSRPKYYDRVDDHFVFFGSISDKGKSYSSAFVHNVRDDGFLSIYAMYCGGAASVTPNFVHIYLILDSSGSIDYNSWRKVIDAVIYAIDPTYIDPDDDSVPAISRDNRILVTIVQFSTQAYLECSAFGPVNELNYVQLIDVLEHIYNSKIDAMTSITDAINVSYSSPSLPGFSGRVILMTDGVHNTLSRCNSGDPAYDAAMVTVYSKEAMYAIGVAGADNESLSRMVKAPVATAMLCTQADIVLQRLCYCQDFICFYHSLHQIIRQIVDTPDVDASLCGVMFDADLFVLNEKMYALGSHDVCNYISLYSDEHKPAISVLKLATSEMGYTYTFVSGLIYEEEKALFRYSKYFENYVCSIGMRIVTPFDASILTAKTNITIDNDDNVTFEVNRYQEFSLHGKFLVPIKSIYNHNFNLFFFTGYILDIFKDKIALFVAIYDCDSSTMKFYKVTPYYENLHDLDDIIYHKRLGLCMNDRCLYITGSLIIDNRVKSFIYSMEFDNNNNTLTPIASKFIEKNDSSLVITDMYVDIFNWIRLVGYIVEDDKTTSAFIRVSANLTSGSFTDEDSYVWYDAIFEFEDLSGDLAVSNREVEVTQTDEVFETKITLINQNCDRTLVYDSHIEVDVT